MTRRRLLVIFCAAVSAVLIGRLALRASAPPKVAGNTGIQSLAQELRRAEDGGEHDWLAADALQLEAEGPDPILREQFDPEALRSLAGDVPGIRVYASHPLFGRPGIEGDMPVSDETLFSAAVRQAEYELRSDVLPSRRAFEQLDRLLFVFVRMLAQAPDLDETPSAAEGSPAADADAATSRFLAWAASVPETLRPSRVLAHVPGRPGDSHRVVIEAIDPSSGRHAGFMRHFDVSASGGLDPAVADARILCRTAQNQQVEVDIEAVFDPARSLWLLSAASIKPSDGDGERAVLLPRLQLSDHTLSSDPSWVR